MKPTRMMMLAALAALVALPGSAMAEADAPGAEANLSLAHGNCSDLPYYEELVCRARKAVCALICRYAVAIEQA